MITVWGLKNCDTCKKARIWLDGRNAAYAFKDVRADGLDEARIAAWLDAVGADTLINRRGTTWRGLDDAGKARAETSEGAVALMVEHPALIKRPVFEVADGTVIVGFASAQQADLETRL